MAKDTLESLPQMNMEWQAWQAVCGELTKLGVDINKTDDLAKSLRRWGEELVALRVDQEPEVRERALLDYRRDYPTLPKE